MADDPLAKWRALDDAPATSAAGDQAAPDADPLAKWRELDAAPAGDGKDAGPRRYGAENTAMRRSPQAPGPNEFSDTLKAAATGAIKNLPIIGAPLDAASTNLAASLKAKGMTAGGPGGMFPVAGGAAVPFDEAKAGIQAESTKLLAEHPVAATAGGMAATTALMAPIGMTAAGAKLLGLTGPMLERMGLGFLSGSAIGATDAATRGEDPIAGGAVGGAFGLVAPPAGKAIGAVGSRLFGGPGMVTSAAADAVGARVSAGGRTAADLRAELAANPSLRPVDVDENLLLTGQRLAAKGGPDARAAITNSVASTRETAPATINKGFDAAFGDNPDPAAVLGSLRAKQAASAPLSADATRTAFTDAMGAPVDPHAAMESLLQKRSADAGPLYDKALNRPIQWDNRLQQFVDDPIVQSGIAKGVEVQRLEALAAGKRFDPNDYAVSVDADGKATIGAVPNMKTLSVVKEGLDAMVESETDQTTGRLTKHGRAIDQVRKAFLDKLDQVNPDYKAARQAWAGPTKDRLAFEAGTKDFQGGATNIKASPEALQAWMARASDSEKEQRILGARSGLEMQMRGAADPAAKAQAIAGIENNRQKLTALMGKDEASSLIERLTTKYADPVGEGFGRGLNVLRNRTGEAGILEDSPAALQAWKDKATPDALDAAKQGARVRIAQSIGAARNAARTGEATMKPDFNRQKAAILLGDDEAARLFKTLDDQTRIAASNAKLTGGSKTAETNATDASIAMPEEKIPLTNKLFGYGLKAAPGYAAGYYGGQLFGGGDPALGHMLGSLGAAGTTMLLSGAERAAGAIGQGFAGARNRMIAEAITDPSKFTKLLGNTKGRGAKRLADRAATLAIRSGSIPASRLLGTGP